MAKQWELVEYDCEDGPCLMIHERTTDSKLGALSPDHKDIGEAIIEELNKKDNKLPLLRDGLRGYFGLLKHDAKSISEKAIVEMIQSKVYEILKEVFEDE